MDHDLSRLVARRSAAMTRARGDISPAHLQGVAALLFLVVAVLVNNVSVASATAILMPSGVALAMRDRARSRQIMLDRMRQVPLCHVV